MMMPTTSAPTPAPDIAPQAAPALSLDFDPYDFQTVRDRLRLRLMSEDLHPDVGERFYSFRVGQTDLFAIISLDVSSFAPERSAYMLASPAVRDAWREQGYTDDTVWAAAIDAETVHGYSVRALWEVLRDIQPDFEDEPAMHEGLPLYAVTTKGEPSFGAAGILLPSIQEAVHERCGESAFLIGSSIHETLVMPTVCAPDAPDLVEMVRSINAAVVDPREVLSDHLYRLDKDGNLFTVL